jgi:hypothetical protein
MREVFNGPCDTSVALNTMQAYTDIGHTRAPVETATESPGNCGDISSGSTILEHSLSTCFNRAKAHKSTRCCQAVKLSRLHISVVRSL